MKKDKSIIHTILYQVFPILLFTSIGEGFTGILLNGMEKELVLLPGLLILVPAITDMRGNIGTAFGSRLSTMLHIGLIKPVFRLKDLVLENIYASFSLSLGMAIFLGFLAHIFSLILGIKSIGPIRLIIIAILSSFISSLILLPIVFFLTIFLYRKGIDPDNAIAPILPVFGDIITVGAIFFSARLILRFSLPDLSFIHPYLFFLSLALISSDKRGKYRYISIIKESIPILFLCSLLSGISGTILRKSEEVFLLFPGVLSLVPQVVEKGGSIGGVIGARMSTALYLGQTRPFKIDKVTLQNFTGGALTGIVISPFVGLFVSFLLWIFGVQSISFVLIIILSVISISTLSISMSLLAILLSSLSFYFDLNPSNVVIPIITSVGDIFGVSLLLIVLHFLK